MATKMQLHRVQLRDVPVEIWQETQLWVEGLLREFDIIAAETETGTPRELLDFVAEVSEKFDRFSNDPNAVLEEAGAAGKTSVDVEYEFPAEAAQASRDMWTHLVAADDFCRKGNLLTIELKDEHRRFVKWYLDEVADQIEGAEPHPWTGQSSPR